MRTVDVRCPASRLSKLTVAALLALVALLLAGPSLVHAVQPMPGVPDDAGLLAPHESIEAIDPAAGESTLSFVLTVLTVLAAPASLGLIYWRRWNKLDGKTLRQRLFEPVVGLGLLFMLFAASALGAYSAQSLFFEYDGDPATMPIELQLKALTISLSGSYAAQAIVLVLASLMLRPRTKSRVPRSHRHAVSLPGAVLAGMGALALFWPLVATAGLAASLLQQWLRDEPVESIAHETLAMLVNTPSDGWRAALLVLVIVGAAVFEEIFYRGILHRLLRGLMFKPWHAVIITSVIFTLMHGNVAPPHALVALFVLALGLGWIYERTGRLAAPIAMHMTFNLANAALALLATSS
jgi:membrane protease YdiL (CAAX protease family)